MERLLSASGICKVSVPLDVHLGQLIKEYVEDPSLGSIKLTNRWKLDGVLDTWGSD